MLFVATDLLSSTLHSQKLDKSSFFKIKKKLEKKKIKLYDFDKITINQKRQINIFWGNRIKIKDLNTLPNLKWVHFASSGIDYLIYKKIKLKKIKVSNTKKIFSDPVSNTVLSYIFYFYKGLNFIAFSDKTRFASRDIFNKNYFQINDLYGKKILLVGHGIIAKVLKKKLKSFSTEISVFKKNKSKKKNFFSNSLSKAVRNQDIVVNTLPLNDSTRNIFDIKVFKKFKKYSLFINVGRGETVNEKDLLNILDKNFFLGVALDVMQNEPLSKNKNFLNRKNVLITPHIAGFSNKFIDDQIKLFEKNLTLFKKNKRMINQL